MIPWHSIRRTPEEEADLMTRLRRMHARLDMPTEILTTETGFMARRDGNTGYGSTPDEAKRNLWDEENQDVSNPRSLDGDRKFASSFPSERFNIPWHLVKRTPEEEADLMNRLQQMHRRLDMPTDVFETEDGYIASRDGNSGYGSTPDEAKYDLWHKENQDATNPSTPVNA